MHWLIYVYGFSVSFFPSFSSEVIELMDFFFAFLRVQLPFFFNKNVPALTRRLNKSAVLWFLEKKTFFICGWWL